MGYVTVKVEGDDQEQVSGVAAGVMVGLENTGFKNVKLAVEYEAKDMEAVIHRDRSLDAPSTMLATLKMRNPALFEQPVMVHVPVVKPTGGLTVYATEDNIILEEKDERPHHQPMQLPGTTEYPANKHKPPYSGQRLGTDESEYVADAIEAGLSSPFDGRKIDASPARAAALGILWDLSDRGGVGNELDCLDDTIRQQITERLTNIINTSFNTAELYGAVDGLVKKGILSPERASAFLHSMNTLVAH